MKIFLRILCAF